MTNWNYAFMVWWFLLVWYWIGILRMTAQNRHLRKLINEGYYPYNVGPSFRKRFWYNLTFRNPWKLYPREMRPDAPGKWLRMLTKHGKPPAVGIRTALTMPPGTTVTLNHNGTTWTVTL